MTLRVKRTISRRDPRKGFTLIELLVVIAIIGILAAVVLVSLNSARARGRDARRISDMQSVSLAMELYADANNSVYPDVTAAAFNATTFTDFAGVLQTDKYLPQIPADPIAGRLYVADASAATQAQSYILGVDLEQNNPACATDYDGADVDGGGATLCADEGPNSDCAGDDTNAVDFCICVGPDC